ncbi:hypothetical protein EDD18DRAFT_1463113 [Armillaria luteobubalina]|uniref:F-box domain-containing protein n=1 Tax=Armillaria luteobubalina TaxID=153913 RepID=A0AA39Q451_9AGAR|nr:hypothetical protein EDD18DRAFT_1463113 [Armillaria luteobubalina]
MTIPSSYTVYGRDSTPSPSSQQFNISKSPANFQGNLAPSPSTASQLAEHLQHASVPVEIRIEADLLPLEKRNHVSSLKPQVLVALSPIRILPTEIFIEVFRYSVVVNAFDCSKGPWLLAQVCSTWREIITTHCPRLWSTILIEICDYRCEDPVSLLKTVLDRSGQSDLRIKFWETSIEEYAAKQMLNLLLEVSNRWSNVILDLQPGSLSSLSVVRGRLDRLSSMTIKYHGIGQPPSRIDAFEIAPLLNSINIVVRRDDDATTIVPCGSESLQAYRNDRTYGDVDLHRVLLDTILKSPNLDSLWAYYHNCTTAASRPLTARINSTSIRFLQTSEGALLDSLLLSALETVWLGPDKPCQSLCPEDTLPSLLGLITASQCSLTRLVLAEVDISHGLIPVLQHIPILDSLEMYFAWWSNPLDRTMQLLVTAMMESKAAPAANPATPFRPAILPALTCFKIEIRDVSKVGTALFINDMFVRMLSIRRTMPADADNKRLQSVTVSLSKSSVLRTGLTSDFQTLQVTGMDLSVSVSESTRGRDPILH